MRGDDEFLPSVCIDAVFEGKPVAEACATVRETGIPAVEFWGWWDRDLDELVAARDAEGLAFSACCTKFISLVDPASQEAYLEGLRQSIEVATDLGIRTLISQVGDVLPGVPRSEQHDALVGGLREAAAMLRATDITLVIEPLNELVDHPGYYLVQSPEAFEIVQEVASPHVQVVFDIYHQQISEGNVLANLRRHLERGHIGHLHAAGNPGRHELQRGELHYRSILSAIKETGYTGYVGLEYWPADEDPLPALREVAGWMRDG